MSRDNYNDRDRPDRQDRITEYVAIEGMVIEVREKAIKFSSGNETYWLPISTCRGLPTVIVIKQYMEFEVEEWIAKTKGLI